MGNPGSEHHLQINEIFRSLQGEGQLSGEPTVFIRTQGCNLTCSWCDSADALDNGQSMELEEILNKVKSFSCRNICVTGGEPLMHRYTQELFSALAKQGYYVSVETNGTHDIGEFKDVDRFTVDYKLTSAQPDAPFMKSNFYSLQESDELKFVIADRNDFDEAVKILDSVSMRAKILFSPCWNRCSPEELADWILEKNLPVRLSLQIHKIIWGSIRGK